MASNTEILSGRGIGQSLVSGIIGFFDFLVKIAEADGRLRRIRELQEMSDEDLAARGLKRQDIVHHVFGYAYYH